MGESRLSNRTATKQTTITILITTQKGRGMAFDDSLIVDHLLKTHSTELLSEREKHLIGLAVTMTRGCQVCTRNRVEKARGIGITDEELNAVIAVASAVNSGVTAATARVAFGMLDEQGSAECGDICSADPQPESDE